MGQSLKGKAVLAALTRRELENYLLVPRAIAAYINERATVEQTALRREATEEQISVELEECAEELKDFAIESRAVKLLCEPLYPNRRDLLSISTSEPFERRIEAEFTRLQEQLRTRREKLPSVTQDVRRNVDTQWDVRKLQIVPGDHLLDRVFSRYGIRFRKERDSVRLATYLQPEEIDGEIATLLKQIDASS
jgi:putative ATP-dependent endonuclease of OLD family